MYGETRCTEEVLLKSDTVARSLAALAGILSISAFAIYNWKIFAGEASPNITSWFLWGTLTILNVTSYKAMTHDWVKSALPTINSTLCLLTFFFTLFFGKVHGLGGYDIAVLIIGVTAVVVWWLFRSSKSANLLVQVALAVAFIPTYLSVIADPSTEIALSWFLWAACFLLQTVVVILRWKKEWVELVYPLSNFGLQFALGILALA